MTLMKPDLSADVVQARSLEQAFLQRYNLKTMYYTDSSRMKIRS